MWLIGLHNPSTNPLSSLGLFVFVEMKIYSWLWEEMLILFVNVPKRIMKISTLDGLFMFNAITKNLELMEIALWRRRFTWDK